MMPGKDDLERKKPPLRLTSGEFGIEVDSFAKDHQPSPQMVALLATSPTFMSMARELDQRYVALATAEGAGSWEVNWKPNDDGVLASGPFAGRRVLAINGLTARIDIIGTRFERAGSPEMATTAGSLADFIFIEPGTVTEMTERLAHEATHAFNRVTLFVKLPPDASRAARVSAAIGEEVRTREQTNKILSEIEAAATDRFKFERSPTERWAVERDFFPGKRRATYLEHFVFSDLIREQVRFQILDEDAIEASNRQVDRLKLGRPLDVFLNTEFPADHTADPESKIIPGAVGAYFELRLVLRVMSARWREFAELKFSDASALAKAREKVLQDHARAFFPRRPEEIRYTPMP